MRKVHMILLALLAGTFGLSGQSFTEILGRPSGNSVTLSILFDQGVEVYVEYGTAPGTFPFALQPVTAGKDQPLEIVIGSLTPDTRYHYRTRYKASGSTSNWLAGTEHTFHTARPPGKAFTFAIEADPHLDANSNPDAYTLTLQNMVPAGHDFLIDLGDTFFSEKQPGVNQAIVTERHLLYRPYFGSVCHSSPLFLVLGNHEGECGWRNDGTAGNIAVMASNTRKLYYPNPLPDSFYSGNEKPEPFVGLRGNYYAWEWGDALFVVLDPYWYTIAKPGWGWTLGADQYNWFKNTLTQSKAKFKFVFCHNLVGGDGTDARGGSEFAHLFEMGGENLDGTWGFDANRPGWGKPIHQLMVENHVTIFFHGHDHFYGKQEKDGVIYQVVPQPSTKNATNLPAPSYGYINGLFLPGRGYLSVAVTGEEVRVGFVRTWLPAEESVLRKNREVAYQYTVEYQPSSDALRSLNGGILEIEPNFPNPFRTSTVIRFSLSQAKPVMIEVFNLSGDRVGCIDYLSARQGDNLVSLDARAMALPPGVYICRITSGDSTRSVRMVCSG